MMVYPLRLVRPAPRPADRALIERSLAHWIGFEGALQGYSFVGASAISSLLGKGEDAARYLDELLPRFVKPNTMYLEAGPVIETPLAAAQAVHEMLLQSWGGVLRVFPAVPAGWKDAAFHDLRAEGAFLVSAVRRGGRTALVRVHSLAGEPARLRVDMPDAEVVAPPGTAEPPGGRQLEVDAGPRPEAGAAGPRQPPPGLAGRARLPSGPRRPVRATLKPWRSRTCSRPGATDYARYRPTYPPALFAWLAEVSPGRALALDVGTGNGQAAVALAAHFDQVDRPGSQRQAAGQRPAAPQRALPGGARREHRAWPAAASI